MNSAGRSYYGDFDCKRPQAVGEPTEMQSIEHNVRNGEQTKVTIGRYQ